MKKIILAAAAYLLSGCAAAMAQPPTYATPVYATTQLMNLAPSMPVCTNSTKLLITTCSIATLHGNTYDGAQVAPTFSSTVAIGTAPISVVSTTVVPRLNVSQLLGQTWASPGAIGTGTPSTGTFTTLSASTLSVSTLSTAVLTATATTGTAPISVVSTTVVPNLNVSQLLGQTWANPGAIGGTTPASGAFSALLDNALSASLPVCTDSSKFFSTAGCSIATLAANTYTAPQTAPQFISTNTTGTAPFVVTSTTAVANLNSSLLLGQTWASPGTIGGTAPGLGNFSSTVMSGNGFTNLALSSAPSSICTGGSFSCDRTHQPLSLGLTVTGAATLTQPTSVYTITPNAAVIYKSAINQSGFNSSTTTAGGGRTGYEVDYCGLQQIGQGDGACIFGSVFINSIKAESKFFLNNPAGILINGQVSSNVDGAYLEPIGDIKCVDNAHDDACLNVIVMSRGNATGALNVNDVGWRIQSTSAAPIDAFASVNGPTRIGLHLNDASYPYVTLKSISFVSGGTGYSTGDILCATGGTFTGVTGQKTCVQVISAPGGVIASVEGTGWGIERDGLYTATPTSPNTFTTLSGTGSGGSFSMTYTSTTTAPAITLAANQAIYFNALSDTTIYPTRFPSTVKTGSVYAKYDSSLSALDFFVNDTESFRATSAGLITPSLTVSSSVILSAITSANCLGTDISGTIQVGSCGSGSGNVTASGSFTNGHVVVANNTSGTSVVDGGALATVATSGSASDLGTGTLPAARLPNPSATTLGGVKSLAAVSHQFLTSISTAGAPTQAQPAAADITGLAASATTDTTNAANISTGTLPLARISSLLFGSAAVGVVPASGGGTANFLRADGTWASPSGSGNVSASGTFTAGDLVVANNTSGTAVISGGSVGSAAHANTGTSGATVPVNNANNTTSGNNTHSGTETFSSTVTLSSLPASAPLCTDGSRNVTAGSCLVGNSLITSSAIATDATVGSVPINATIIYAIARETAGHNVTISLGSTSGASDVLTSVALTANTSTMIPITSFTKSWFSSGSTQSLFIDSASWGSASVNISIYYVVGP